MEKLHQPRMAHGLIIGAMCALALAACGEKEAKLQDGRPAEVYEHEYTPASTGVIIVNKIPIFINHPAQYYLDVQQCGFDVQAGYDNVDPSGCLKEQVSVTHETYQQYPDGSQITFANVR